MNESSVKIFYGNYIDVVSSELYWYDFNLGLMPLSESPHVKFVNAVYNNENINNTEYVKSCRRMTNDTVEGNGEKFAELANTIRAWGYDETSRPKVMVGIDSIGRIIITDGLHRSAIMHCLGLPIPCEVIYRDAKWWDLKHALYFIWNEAKLYQSIEHADFSNWPCWRFDTKKRIFVVNKWLKIYMPNAKNGIDFGCHTGNISIGMANKGYQMVGIDIDKKVIKAAKALSRMKNIGAPIGTVFYDSATVLESDSYRNFDFAICLSLLNHYASKKERWEDGWNVFRILCKKSPVVFYDCPSPGDPVGGNTELIDPIEMTNWLRASGVAGDGRVIMEKNEELQRTLLVWRNNL